MGEVKISVDEEHIENLVIESVEDDAERKNSRKFLYCSVGIFVCGFILGILQEMM